MPPSAITKAIAELTDIDELEILKAPSQHEDDSRWMLKIRLTPESINQSSNLPKETDWYVRIDPTYPGGNIGIYPANENGIKQTYPHQSLNTPGSADRPWRAGNICVDRYEHSLSRLGGFQEPFDGTERLKWHICRAIKWLELADIGELRQEGDPYELPAFDDSHGRVQFAYNETRSSFDTWSATAQNYGIAHLSRPQHGNTCNVVDFVDLNGDTIYTPEWGDSIAKDTTVPGVWWLLDEPPIKPPWEVPENWDDLTELLPASEQNTFTILGKTRQAFPSETFEFVLIGFPIPKDIGGDNAFIHWQAIKIDDIPRAVDFNGFRELEGNQIRLARMSFKNEGITWVESDNWAQNQLLRRGKLDKSIRESNIELLGAGALGSTVAENLLRDGCTDITIVDGEQFEIGNLARHTLGLESLAQSKATALADRLRPISPHATIHEISSHYPYSRADGEDLPEPDVILDCTGNDQVLYALENEHWETPKLVVSTSLGPQGNRLYTYATYTHTFDVADFEERFQPWTLRDLSEHRPDEDMIPERVGCWHPASVITMNTIARWGSVVPELIEESVELGRGQASFKVMETTRNHGSPTVQPRNDPFPEALRWTSGDDKSLELPRACLDEMVNYFQQDSPDETGGILTGVYTDEAKGRIIRGSDPPPDSIQSRTTFVRGTEKVEESLKESRERYGLYYLGEWHTHPDRPPTLSGQDAGEMQSIADNESYECPYPFLVIIGGNADTGFTIKPYLFTRNKDYEELTLDRETVMSDSDVDTSTGAVVYRPGGLKHD